MYSQNTPVDLPARHPDPISAIVRDVVCQVAPAELPIVDGLAALDHPQVVRRVRQRPRKREQLGFGLGEVAVLVTPILWLVLDQAAQQVAGSAVKGTGNGLKALTRKLLRRSSGAVALPALNQPQLDLLWQEVVTAARQKGLPDEQARELADALVSRVARGAAGQPPSIEPER
jgi:hypothetical protein